MGRLPDRERLQRNFARCHDWEERYLYMIELGEQLPTLGAEQRRTAQQVSGCQSQVWLGMERDAQGGGQLYGDSDAALVKGLLAIVVIGYRDMTPAQIVTQDLRPLLDALALSQHLTPSRTQGMGAMIQAVREQAALLG